MRESGKRRLDMLLVERGLAPSRERAQALILAGHVAVAGRPGLKSGSIVAGDADVQVRQPPVYVSRGGFKLAGALNAFGIDCRDRVAIDVGASTGGFTDVLLQRAARRVYAIDVGYGQLTPGLRADSRVVVMDRTNIRYLDALPEAPTLCTIDVSFISLRLVLPAVGRLLAPNADVAALVKPQFEAGRQEVARGVVRDPEVWRSVLESLVSWMASSDWWVRGLQVSSLKGGSGNVEFFAHLRLGQGASLNGDMVDRVLAQAARLT